MSSLIATRTAPPRAVIDIGSNSVLLLVAQRQGNGALRILEDRSVVTRLSEGAAKSGVLKPAAIERTLATLHEYTQIARRHGAVAHAVATEGVRMASNQDAFLTPAAEVLGEPVNLISGDEEARLSFLSVAKDAPADEVLHVLDIGGGSTELVVGQGDSILQAQSHPIGSVRLTESFVRHDPPQPAEIAAMERAAREAFARQPVRPQEKLYGLAGTVTSCAALLAGLSSYDRERVDGSTWSLEAVKGLRDRLAQLDEAGRRAYQVLGRGRADVIIAGVTILIAAMEHCGASTLVVRDRGLRFALVDSAVEH
jgi:exopolyphosphatase/guanosine-5'-triphosphate,3'-diphosphate pyrophosphatase